MTILRSNAFTVSVVATPSYIAGMATYDVLSLASPTNGNVDMTDVTPAEWITSDPGGGLKAVTSAWCGGAGDPAGRRLFVHGGGHADSANNGLYIYDYNGTTNPTGWTLAANSLSVVADVPSDDPVQSYEEYLETPDGYPASVHTYNGCGYDSVRDQFFRCGGSPWQNGGFTDTLFAYDFGTSQWERKTDYPSFAGNAPHVVANPTTGKLLVQLRNSTLTRFFDPATDTWSGSPATPDILSLRATVGYDSLRERLIIIGAAGVRLLWTIDWTLETIATSTFTPSGTAAELAGLDIGSSSVAYDASRDSYWIFGSETQAEYVSIWEMDASTWAVTKTTLTGDAFQFGVNDSNYWGSWHRFVYFDDWRAIGFVTSHQDPAYIIRLP